jgi:drug/metabolite transporter (DMT)-like permease
MQKNLQQRAYMLLHIAVFLFGFTAILGKLINLDALVLVWWRLLITLIVFGLYPGTIKNYKSILPENRNQILRIGIIVLLHWLCFYGSIKLANASVALICLASTALFSSILEPIILKRPFQWYEVLLGFIVIPGMALIVGSLDFSMILGFVVGIGAALFASIFSIYNKKVIASTDAITFCFTELLGGFIALSIILPVVYQFHPTPLLPSTMDWIYLLVLAIFCTNIAYVLSIKALHHLSAFATNLTVNLEPVYGIIMAIFFLHEDKTLNIQFYLGSAIVLGSVLTYPWVKQRFHK